MPITALPTPPSRQDPTNFNDRADAFLGALPQFQSEANDLQTDVNSKQSQASTSASNAAASALAAASTAGASIWVSGTSYFPGDNRFSPLNFLTYRRKTTGTSSTDPSLDSTNWQLLTSLGDVSTTGDQTIDGLKTFTNPLVVDTLRIGRPSGVATNLVIGNNSLPDTSTGYNNTVIGSNSQRVLTTGHSNVSIGNNALYNATGCTTNVVIGNDAGYNITNSFSNVIIGHNAGKGGTGSTSVLIGRSAGESASGQSSFGNTVAVGAYSLDAQTFGSFNTAVGHASLGRVNEGSYNSGLGNGVLSNLTTGNFNTALGSGSGDNLVSFDNTTCLGYEAQVTASNQVQLGDSTTTTYVYGTVQNRSDLRDKTEVRDTVLGLDFINALRPVDYKWDMRDDYKPARPEEPDEDATEEQKSQYQILLDQWLEACKPENITRNGSKKRNRYHHGLIAQEVKSVIDTKGIDFGGYQDHKIAGGHDVLSIGYDELIAPLIKAVQELTKKVQDLEKELAAK